MLLTSRCHSNTSGGGSPFLRRVEGCHGPADPEDREMAASTAARGRPTIRSSAAGVPCWLDRCHGRPRVSLLGGGGVWPLRRSSSWTHLWWRCPNVVAEHLVPALWRSDNDVPWLPRRWEMNMPAYVARSRAAQGLGPRITDPIVLNRIAQLLAEPRGAALNGAQRATSGRRHIEVPGMQESHETAVDHGR
jgi:hypothetical protein